MLNEGPLDSSPVEPVGRTHVVQDAAAREEPEMPAAVTPAAFLDQRVGYVTLRWAVLPLVGLMLGIIVGVVAGEVAYHLDGADQDRGFNSLVVGMLGFLAGAPAVFLIRAASFLAATRGTWRERLADWASLR